MGNFVFSALAAGYLKTEVEDVKDNVDDQAALAVKLASDADLLSKKVSSNCQKVNNVGIVIQEEPSFKIATSKFYSD